MYQVNAAATQVNILPEQLRLDYFETVGLCVLFTVDFLFIYVRMHVVCSSASIVWECSALGIHLWVIGSQQKCVPVCTCVDQSTPEPSIGLCP